MKKTNFTKLIVDAVGMAVILWLTALVNAPPILAAQSMSSNWLSNLMFIASD
jgi:hypothetical protein